MSMIVNHNLPALNTYNQLNMNGTSLSKSLSKLSSGLRINGAADDAAGLAISEKMRGQIRGLNQANRNAQDGVSLLQTAEGALGETQNILQRMRELAVQSASDTNTDNDRAQIQKEVSQLISEIDRIGNNTQFNNRNLLDGGAGVQITATTNGVSNLKGTADTTAGTVSITAANTALAAKATLSGGSAAIKAEANASANFNGASTISIAGTAYSFTVADTIQDALDAINADSASTGVSATFANGTGFTFTATQAGSAYSIAITASGTGDFDNGDTVFDVATTAGTDASFSVAELGGSYDSAGNHVQVTSGNYKGLEFDISADADVDITIAANNSLKLHVGANADQNLSISINDMRSDALGVDAVNVATRDGANAAITTIQNAIDQVSTERAKMGAVEDRLEYTADNLATASENMTAAESRIRDVDMASEMANYTKLNVLSQAATAMLAQANQLPQQVLSLLK